MGSIPMDQPKLPAPSDFTEKALQSAVIRNANNHWLVRYSLPLAMGTAVFGGLFGFSYPLFLGILGILGSGAASWVYKVFVDAPAFKQKHIKELHAIVQEHTDRKRAYLRIDLQKTENNHALKQVNLFEQKFATLVEILQTKFDPSQLTYSRYYGIAQEVYLSGIDNLTKVLLAHKTLESIDLKYLNERLGVVNNEDPNNKAVAKERAALLRSKDSYAHQKNMIREILADNEAALTQLDEAAIEIAAIKRSNGEEANLDMENSMKALSQLVEQSKYYSR